MSLPTNIFDANVKEVSGPINVLRLEGEVNATRKVIYLFMLAADTLPIEQETECPNVFSKDIEQYLALNFYHARHGSKIYDFFLNMKPSVLSFYAKENEMVSRKAIYIYQIVKFFSKLLNYDPDKNLVKMSDIFNNVRLHYFDIQNYIVLPLLSELNSAKNLLQHDRLINNMNELLTQIATHIYRAAVMVKELEAIYQNKTEISEKIKPFWQYKYFPTEFYPNAINYLFNKMKKSYKHKLVKKKLTNYLDHTMKEIFDSQKQMIDFIVKILDYHQIWQKYKSQLYFNKYLQEYCYTMDYASELNIYVDLYQSFAKIYYKQLRLFDNLTNIYFLRRFLDKDYVTNAVVCIDPTHILYNVDILVNDFDFKITHASYMSTQSVTELNDQFKKFHNNYEELVKLINPSQLIQCANLTNFPENFE